MDFDEVGENESEEHIEDILLLDAEENQLYTSLKDCVIFLVDCSESMQKVHNNTSSITQVLNIAESFLKTKIITNEKDLFGLVLFNTEKQVNEMGFSGVNYLIQISPPDASLIKKIKNLEQNTNPILCKDYLLNLQKDFGALKDQTKCYLSNALWICHAELKKYDKKNFKRRIFLFTDKDNPLSDNINERNLIIQRAKDMFESEIIIELFPTNFDSVFDLRKFYMNIIPASEEGDEVLKKDHCEDRLRELTKRIRQKEVKKRTLGKCPFYITSNTKIYMNFYGSIKKSAKGRIFNVDAKSNKLLSMINQVTCKETASNLYPNQIGTFQVYGGKKILFTRDEMKKIKTLDDPGIKLMGFKSLNCLKPYFNVRESYFLYPDENLTSGASQLCDALIKQMASKNKFAIVKFVPREGSNVKFCAMLPQKESFDEDYFQNPPGFNLIPLPYADDIRSNSDIMKKMPQGVEISTHQSEFAKKLIKKMNISFDSRNFENPTIQKFYATLQALALEENEVENVEDLINPDESLTTILNGVDEEFSNAFFGSNQHGNAKVEEENERKGKKIARGKNKDKSKSRSKEKNMDLDDVDKFSDDNLKKMCNDDSIADFTVPQLKDICKLKHISLKAKKKTDIIDELKQFIKKKI